MEGFVGIARWMHKLCLVEMVRTLLGQKYAYGTMSRAEILKLYYHSFIFYEGSFWGIF